MSPQGRNRCVFKTPPVLTTVDLSLGPRVAATLNCENNSTLSVTLDQGVTHAAMLIRDGAKEEAARLQAVTFLKACLGVLVARSPEDLGMTHATVSYEAPSAPDSWYLEFQLDHASSSARGCFVNVVVGLLIASADMALKGTAVPILEGLLRRCAILSCLQANVEKRPQGTVRRKGRVNPKERVPNREGRDRERDKEGKYNSTPKNNVIRGNCGACALLISWDTHMCKKIPPEAILEAIILAMANDDPAVVAAAQSALSELFHHLEKIMDGHLPISSLPIVGVLCHLACTSCYRREWLMKASGCAASSFLIERVDQSWLRAKMQQISRVKMPFFPSHFIFSVQFVFFSLSALFLFSRLFCHSIIFLDVFLVFFFFFFLSSTESIIPYIKKRLFFLP